MRKQNDICSVNKKNHYYQKMEKSKITKLTNSEEN